MSIGREKVERKVREFCQKVLTHMKMYAIIYKHYECAVLAGVAEQADAADLKSADTKVSYRFKSGHRHHTVPQG